MHFDSKVYTKCFRLILSGDLQYEQFVYIYSFDHRKSDSSHSNKGMSPRPSIIRVAPATDAISNQTVDQNHPPRRSSFFDDSDFAVPKQEELDQASDAGRITSK